MGGPRDELPFCWHWRAKWPGHLVAPELAVEGREQPVAPIRKGYLRGCPAGATRTACSSRSRLRRVGGAPELVGRGDEMAHLSRPCRHLGAESVLQVDDHLIDEPVHVVPLLAGVSSERMVRDDELVRADLGVAAHDVRDLRRSADDARHA